jgi:hypothetical protein
MPVNERLTILIGAAGKKFDQQSIDGFRPFVLHPMPAARHDFSFKVRPHTAA